MEDRTRRVVRTASLFAAAVAIGATGWLAGRTSTLAISPAVEQAEAARVDAVAFDTAAAAASTSASGRARAVPDRPLPPIEAPLRETLADLRKRADGGEAGAACRLAAEMEYCNGMRRRLESNTTMLRRSESSFDAIKGVRDPSMVAGMRAAQRTLIADGEQLLAESEHCSDVPHFHPDERVRYWRAAAMAGNVAAQRHYAVGNAFLLDDSLENLDELRVYRSEAEAVAWRAVNAGDLPTTLALAQAYAPVQQSPRRYLLAQSVRPDGVKSLALLLLVQSRIRSASPPPSAMPGTPIAIAIQELEDVLQPEQRERARRQAADFHRSLPRSEAEASAVNGAFFHGTQMLKRQQCGDVPAGSS